MAQISCQKTNKNTPKNPELSLFENRQYIAIAHIIIVVKMATVTLRPSAVTEGTLFKLKN